MTRQELTAYIESILPADREAMDAALFPHHPYGTQTVLGTQEHLKNPSITNVRNYHKTYYVPNNMAICLSGDFDPEQMLSVISTELMPELDMLAKCRHPEAPAEDTTH